jgi:hypothetical protein
MLKKNTKTTIDMGKLSEGLVKKIEGTNANPQTEFYKTIASLPQNSTGKSRMVGAVINLDEMAKNTIKWTGENQIEISNFLGSENFHHKNGELFVQTAGGRFTVKKGEFFGINEEGIPYPFVDPHADLKQ